MKKTSYVTLTIATIGMLLAIYGNLLSGSLSQKILYFVSAILLLIAALLDKAKFFVALELIIIGATAIAFTTFSMLVKTLVPIVLSIAVILYFLKQALLKDYLTWLGCLGIVILAIGYAIIHPLIYFLGGLILAIYSFISFSKGVPIAFIWGILNTVFCITAMVDLL